MKIRALRVGTRPALALGVILLIITLIALIGVWRIGTLQQASDRLATREIEQQLLFEGLAANVDVNWVRTQAIFKAVDRGYIAQLGAEMASYAATPKARPRPAPKLPTATAICLRAPCSRPARLRPSTGAAKNIELIAISALPISAQDTFDCVFVATSARASCSSESTQPSASRALTGWPWL